MTNEEARDIFKELKIGTFDGRLGITTQPNDLLNAADVAIEALEKTIPKKPLLKKRNDRILFEQDECYCPTCGEWLTWEITHFKHCYECGQAIDWSEDENNL